MCMGLCKKDNVISDSKIDKNIFYVFSQKIND